MHINISRSDRMLQRIVIMDHPLYVEMEHIHIQAVVGRVRTMVELRNGCRG